MSLREESPTLPRGKVDSKCLTGALGCAEGAAQALQIYRWREFVLQPFRRPLSAGAYIACQFRPTRASDALCYREERPREKISASFGEHEASQHEAILSSMNLHPPIPASLRRPASWPAWPRRGGTASVVDRQSRATGRRLDWPLLLFWAGYLAIFAGGVWVFLP